MGAAFTSIFFLVEVIRASSILSVIKPLFSFIQPVGKLLFKHKTQAGSHQRKLK